MKRETIPLNGARPLRIVPKPSANESRKGWNPGDGWYVIGLACWPLCLVWAGLGVAWLVQAWRAWA